MKHDLSDVVTNCCASATVCQYSVFQLGGVNASRYIRSRFHTKTRKRELVDTMYQLGLSISYSRVLDISSELGNKISHHYQALNVVCPPELKCGLFTTAAVDNIDHNPSFTSAHDAFHGTAQSLFQHPNKDNTGVPQRVVTLSETTTKGPIACLPNTYTSWKKLSFFCCT